MSLLYRIFSVTVASLKDLQHILFSLRFRSKFFLITNGREGGEGEWGGEGGVLHQLHARIFITHNFHSIRPDEDTRG